MLKIERVDIGSVIPDPANLRKHPEKNLVAIKASLRRFGQQKPIVIDGDGIVRAGNGTFAAAQQLGWKEIDVVRTQLKGAEAIAYAIADNRTAELAEWDEETLAQQLSAIQIEDEELAESSGFNAQEIEKMISAGQETDGDLASLGSLEYRVIVHVNDETAQFNLMQRLESEGYKCLPLMS